MAKDFSTLKIEGATAEAAVNCMRQVGIMPSKPYYGDTQHVDVEFSSAGQVAITEYSPFVKNATVGSVMAPAAQGRPAEVFTHDVEATGSIAEKMRQKAVACTHKSIGIAP